MCIAAIRLCTYIRTKFGGNARARTADLLRVKQMEGTLLNELRAGDPFTKVGANQFWVLLPGATGENGGLVSRRVFNRFQKEYPKSGAAYTFKSLDLRHIHMSAEEKATEKTERRKA